MNNLMSTGTRRALPVAAVAGLIALGGCASVPAPVEQMAVADAAVQRANTTSTNDNAAAELEVATAKLARARQAMTRKEHGLARRLAEQAQVDAQVAALRSQARHSSDAAHETQEATRVLAEEIDRTSVR